ncbi:MarR family transcriptional regulator [Aureimonas leprariae]|uniref:MarR family transcriptional regulator n=2 Tax=Plantimonas leprariae TaxID=2615207 RepID=A0A7V7PKE6_9HYPH|nr:MarR family transcriptional regulator [Aureimonas leprariae]
MNLWVRRSCQHDCLSATCAKSRDRPTMTGTTTDAVGSPERFADLSLLPHLLSVSRSVRQLLAMRLVDLDVAVGQDQFLLSFEDDGQVSVAEIAIRLSVRASTVSKMTDRLAAKGWVVRSADNEDARRVLVHLTDEGRAARDAVLRVEAEVEAEILAALAEKTATVSALAELDAVVAKRLRRLR